MKQLSTLVLATALALAAAFNPASAAQAEAQSPAAAPMSEGEIKKIDKDAGKLTIKHGELKNLEMPPMTMIFRVADPAMLDQVQTGSKIRFVAEKRNGAFTVTTMEALK